MLTKPALTRRYLVAPCWKNTRSAGLEVLKGQQKIVLGVQEKGSRLYKYTGCPDRRNAEAFT
jgi:hypothetical protein